MSVIADLMRSLLTDDAATFSLLLLIWAVWDLTSLKASAKRLEKKADEICGESRCGGLDEESDEPRQ